MPTPITSSVQAAPPSAAAPVPEIDPRADQLLNQTCKVLGAANAFSFHAEVLFDQVLPSAVKVQFAGEINFAVQRPDELAIDFHSDLGGKELWYQKDTLTVFDRPHHMYASLKVPDSIDQMLDQVAKMHNLRLPLSNLAYSNPCLRLRKQILYGSYVGVNDVNGVACDHLAFSSQQYRLPAMARPFGTAGSAQDRYKLSNRARVARIHRRAIWLEISTSGLRAVAFAPKFPKAQHALNF